MVLFDTLAYVNKLKEAGFTDNQAELFTVAQKDVFSEVTDTSLATKSDLFNVETALKQDIADVRQELKEDIADVKQELKQDITNVRQELTDVRHELKQDIADVRSELKLLKWMTGLTLAGVVGLLMILLRFSLSQIIAG
ncbi:CCDC90 family protein [Candidatus Magnetomoraceae bacterium gMMP-15]